MVTSNKRQGSVPSGTDEKYTLKDRVMREGEGVSKCQAQAEPVTSTATSLGTGLTSLTCPEPP